MSPSEVLELRTGLNLLQFQDSWKFANFSADIYKYHHHHHQHHHHHHHHRLSSLDEKQLDFPFNDSFLQHSSDNSRSPQPKWTPVSVWGKPVTIDG